MGQVVALGTAAQPSSPGLAPYHQTSTNQDRLEIDETGAGGCPNRRGMVWLNLETAEIKSARCARNGCAYCVVVNARRRALAVAWARPQREIRVSLLADTGDPDPWPTARYRWNRIREYLTRWNVPIGETSIFIEKGSKTGMIHGHVCQLGAEIIDKDALEQASQQAGAGLTRVRKIRNVQSMSQYGLKGVEMARYGLKGADQNGAEFLHLNGGRLGHFSRGFFVSASGVRLGVRAAECEALRAVYGNRVGAGAWTLATEGGAQSYRSLKPASSTAGGPVPVIRTSGSKTAGSTVAVSARSAS